MTSIQKQQAFESLEEFKARAEFFQMGRIIPQRIVCGPRKYKHNVVFGSDTWAMYTPRGYVMVLAGGDRHYSAIKFLRTDQMKGEVLFFVRNGVSYWIGPIGGEDKQLESLNRFIGGEK